MKRNKGISLIVLVITIIIILILAGAVILSLVKSNPIGQSKEAQFKANIDAYNSELNMAISNEYFANHNFDPASFDFPIWDGTGDGTGTIKEYIPSITDDDAEKFKIENSKLVYVGTDELEISWFTDIVAGSGSEAPPEETGLGVDVIATENTTFDGNLANHNNPIIPKGFKAIDTPDAIWPTDWDEGLVIEDESGNQFVWVPIGKDLENYKRNFTYPSYYSATEANTTNDTTTLPSGISEQNQITTYGGFYIARYEAGNASNILVSKKSSTVWNNINYNDSVTKAKTMYDTVEVKSGLITGTQWDTVMNWISNDTVDVKSVTNSSAWGNYSGSLKITGGDSYKAKNIYDLAGNVYEWTSEIYSSDRVVRGGVYDDDGSDYPASYRDNGDPTAANGDLGFRVVLYIL